jgi:hypothetical protein
MNAIEEIKRLYYGATEKTIQRDLARAIDLLRSLATEEDRERVAVYMDGLSQMRSEWGHHERPKGEGRRTKATAARRPDAPRRPDASRRPKD